MKKLLPCLSWTCLALASAHAASINELEAQLKAEPESLTIRRALAEAYLHDCQLGTSLRHWRVIQQRLPDDPRAQLVIKRLTTQQTKVSTQLDIIEQLLTDGLAADIEKLLQDAADQAADPDNKARVRLLMADVFYQRGRTTEAQAEYRGIILIHPASKHAITARLRLLAMAQARKDADAVDEHLVAISNAQHSSRAQKTEAQLLQAVWLSGSDTESLVSSLQALLTSAETSALRLAIYQRLIPALRLQDPSGGQAAQALQAWLPQVTEAREHGQFLNEQQALITDSKTSTACLQTLLAILSAQQCPNDNLNRIRTFQLADVLAELVIRTSDRNEVQKHTEQCRLLYENLGTQSLPQAQRQRLQQAIDHLYLAEAQKYAALDQPRAALPAIHRAAKRLLEQCDAHPQQSLTRLRSLGRLLEGFKEWDLAIAHYRMMAKRAPQHSHGRDALYRSAWLIDRQLGDAESALEQYAHYAARYPAELRYDQMTIGKRLQRLGYTNVLDFQRRHQLVADGVFGKDSHTVLRQQEQLYGAIALDQGKQQALLTGTYVHPRMYQIAGQLRKQGHHWRAIKAYRLCLNLFPTKREADDAVLAIARMFRDSQLYTEALGAYRQLMTDYPKGDNGSLAYIEAAACLVDQGRWDQAEELLKLYVKKFPKKKYVKQCKTDLTSLTSLQQFHNFLKDHPDHPKRAEARYQIARILYKDLRAPLRAAMEFTELAQTHPKHIRAADAWFSAGVALMRLEHFTAASERFTALVAAHPDNRLADDAQFWIGHCHEYQARALGKLDKRRIVLHSRSRAAFDRLHKDLDLRKLYEHADDQAADASTASWTKIWQGIQDHGPLAAAGVQDRVHTGLREAITAYRAVVDTFKLGDKAGDALLRIGKIYTEYLQNTDKGIAAYQELLVAYPGSKQAIDALYAVGKHQMEQKLYQEAIASFKKFIFSYPKASQVQQAMMDIAACHTAQKQWAEGLDAYQSYVNKHPQGSFHKEAKKQIDWIRMYHF